MRKIFLIPLLTLCTCVMAWSATITVGEGGDQATLSDAVAAAEAGDVVQLVSDLNVSGYVFTKAITVDFNGYTINVSTNYGLEVRTAAVTFTDNSLAKNGGITCGKGCLDVYSKVIINGGTFTSTVTGSGAAIWCNGTAEIEVNDINMNASESGIIAEDGRMIINGGNIVADKCVALQLQGNGYFEINGGTIVSNSSLTNQGRTNGRSYAVISGGTFVMNGGSISGVQGGLSLQEDCAGTINHGEIETRYGVDGQHNNHYALYVSTGAVVNVYDGKFKVETPSMGGNRVVLIGNNDAYNYYGVVNMYGGKYQEKAYVTKQKNAESHFPASVPLTSAWYTAFQEKDAANAFAPLPAGYEYYDITEGEDYEAGYRYGVRPVAGKKADAIDPAQQAAQEADPTYTIPWQQATTWATDEVPETNTIVTIPVDATVTVSKDEATKTAVADQVFVAQGASLTVETGTSLTVGDGGVNIGNGGQLVIEKGAIVKVGAAGFITTEDEALVIESTEDAQGIFMLDPAVTENTQPKATVRLYTNSKQLSASPWTYVYQRFAIPVLEGVVPENDFVSAGHTLYPGEESYGFQNYVYEWNGSAWAQCQTWAELEPFKGYQLANNSADGGVYYSFTGNLVGNHNGSYGFTEKGFGYFGNSFTAPINIETMLSEFDSKMQATVWMYDYEKKNFAPIALADFVDFPEEVPFQEIKSMDGFLLYLQGANSGSAAVNYASAIWGNPILNAAPAKHGAKAEATSNRVVLNVKDNMGFGDKVTLVEKSVYSNEFDNGADASKFMNPNTVNMFAVTNEGDLSRVATDNLSNTIISFAAGNASEYTLTMSKVMGEDYILRDNVTGAEVIITEGATYTFTQDAYTTIPARFEIVKVAKVPTAIDNVEAAAKANGIYTVTGQFLGHDFTNLPAGVYVVNGVKIVK